MTENKALILAKTPTGYPIPGEDLLIKSSTIDLNAAPPEGGLILKTHYLSYDPYQRGKMKPPNAGSYSQPYPLDTPVINAGILRVISSSSPRFKTNDIVIGYVAFSEYQIVDAERAAKSADQGGFDVLSNPFGLDEKLFLGALGMSGLTAYSSLYEVGKPAKGETLFVSAASGAVGQIVGQLAKREGMKVIGSVGSEAKRKYIVEELGFDGAFNYKSEKPAEGLKRVLGEIGAKGVDVYYDNVGGEQLDAALGLMNDRGRVVSCGSVSQTSLKPEDAYGVKNMPLVVGKRLTIRGFIVYDPDMGPKYTEEHQKNMQKWIKDGEITVKMSVTEGIENSAEGLVGMLKGENFGKAVLKVSDL
ncbi:NADP-dependent oxidoreductase [Lachnellula suecica]|uniref:NADP-dependent oxidoreductase n=1 Tax=Lachnellula suecica TaxID=602035 RepID=A0A8T9C4J4_9HELO|nr:NADP-dependent oxidoreductase [Lachnellula suecica]